MDYSPYAAPAFLRGGAKFSALKVPATAALTSPLPANTPVYLIPYDYAGLATLNQAPGLINGSRLVSAVTNGAKGSLLFRTADWQESFFINGAQYANNFGTQEVPIGVGSVTLWLDHLSTPDLWSLGFTSDNNGAITPFVSKVAGDTSALSVQGQPVPPESVNGAGTLNVNVTSSTSTGPANVTWTVKSPTWGGSPVATLSVDAQPRTGLWAGKAPGSALSFDGASSLVTETDPTKVAALDTSGDLTMECWIKPQSFPGALSSLRPRMICHNSPNSRYALGLLCAPANDAFSDRTILPSARARRLLTATSPSRPGSIRPEAPAARSCSSAPQT
jgi:hypothetical protein